jgi:hypothetical protein
MNGSFKLDNFQQDMVLAVYTKGRMLIFSPFHFFFSSSPFLNNFNEFHYSISYISMKHRSPPPFIFQCWGLNSRPSTVGRRSVLSHLSEPRLQLFFCLSSFPGRVSCFCCGPASDYSPLTYGLPCNWKHRCMPPCPEKSNVLMNCILKVGL